MKRTRVITFAALGIAALLSAAAAAQETDPPGEPPFGPGFGPGFGPRMGPGFGAVGPGEGPCGRGRLGEFVAERLDLSAEQREAWTALHEELRATLRPLFEESRRLHEAIRDELDGESPDALTVGEMMVAGKEQRLRMKEAREAHERAIAELLTPEQAEKLEEMKARRQARRERGFGGRGGGFHRHRGPRERLGPWGGAGS